MSSDQISRISLKKRIWYFDNIGWFITVTVYSQFVKQITNCVLKHADNSKMISNWLILLSTWFGNLKPFLMNGNRSQTRQTHNRDIISYFLRLLGPYCKLWILVFFSPTIYDPFMTHVLISISNLSTSKKHILQGLQCI